MRETPKYKLPLWDLADTIKRTDVNGLGEKAEAALSSLDALLNAAAYQRSGGAALTNRSGGTLTIPATQLSGRVQIATGSYAGTGTCGEGNPNKLSFAFPPKFVVCAVEGSTLQPFGSNKSWDGSFLWEYGGVVTYVQDYSSGKAGLTYFSAAGNALSWYSTNARSQLNLSEGRYYYVAIG